MPIHLCRSARFQASRNPKKPSLLSHKTPASHVFHHKSLTMAHNTGDAAGATDTQDSKQNAPSVDPSDGVQASTAYIPTLQPAANYPFPRYNYPGNSFPIQDANEYPVNHFANNGYPVQDANHLADWFPNARGGQFQNTFDMTPFSMVPYGYNPMRFMQQPVAPVQNVLGLSGYSPYAPSPIWHWQPQQNSFQPGNPAPQDNGNHALGGGVYIGSVDGTLQQNPYQTSQGPSKAKRKNKKAKTKANVNDTVNPSPSIEPSKPNENENKQRQPPYLKPVENKKKRGSPKLRRPPPPLSSGYVAQALLEPVICSFPQPLLIVLDLNGTLVHRPNRSQSSNIIKRPFLDQFLKYIFDNFCIMVWSSARPPNVRKMVEKVLNREHQDKLIAQWARDELGLSTEDYNQNVQVYKQLTKIWAVQPLHKKHPHYNEGGHWGQHNTILIDDSALKASSEPYNLIEVPEFDGTPEQMKSDMLREVAGYLEQIKMYADVSAFMNKTPFKADGSWSMDWQTDVSDGGVRLSGQTSSLPAAATRHSRMR